METLLFLEKGIWLGLAAIGFAVLFNVPKRALGVIFVIAALGGWVKFFMIGQEIGIISSTFCGATLIGLLSVLAAHNRNAPPVTFAVAAVIPMIPGFFAYKAMVGIIEMTAEKNPEAYTKLFFETVNNGLLALFVILALSLGVAFPLLITRKQTVKNLQPEDHPETEQE